MIIFENTNDFLRLWFKFILMMFSFPSKLDTIKKKCECQNFWYQFNVFSIIFKRVSLQCKILKRTLLFHWGDYLIGNNVTSILLRMISKQIRLSGKDAFGINSVIRRLEFSIERKAILSTKTNFIKALSFPKDYYNFVTAWNIRHCSQY